MCVPLFIMIGQGLGVWSARRGGAEEAEGVGGTLVGKVVDLSRNMYLTKSTAERARVTI